MQNKKTLLRAALCLMVLMPAAAIAQNSSINTFSPYSMYGIGDLANTGSTNMRSMGGAGVAFRDVQLNPYSHSINLLNPASYSSIPQRSFIFSFGLEGENYYLKQGSKKTSYNTFNIKDVAFAFPLAKNLGMSLSLTPYSSTGYRIEEVVTGHPVEGNFLDVRKKYVGEGDLAQIKAGVGYQLFKGLSIGADMVLITGSLDRSFDMEITGIPGSGTYFSSMGLQTERISKAFGLFGAQYNVMQDQKRVLTVGATYLMGGKLKPKIKHSVPTNDYMNSFVASNEYIDRNLTMPNTISTGVYYHTQKLSAGLDYVYSNWGDRNDYNNTNTTFKNTNTIRGGIEYTPNFIDIRKFLNRVTYRIGFRYAENYTKINGHSIDDKAITFGFGMPIPPKNVGRTKLDIGFELGQRGDTGSGLIKENYFKFSLGLRFFGEDYWFVKRKYK